MKAHVKMRPDKHPLKSLTAGKGKSGGRNGRGQCVFKQGMGLFLTGDGGHTWLHSDCHGDWTVRHRARAAAALAILGFRPPTKAF